MEKFQYQANHLAKYRAKMAVDLINRDMEKKLRLPDFMLLISILILLFS